MQQANLIKLDTHPFETEQILMKKLLLKFEQDLCYSYFGWSILLFRMTISTGLIKIGEWLKGKIIFLSSYLCLFE